ncbi:hypothetical protein [Nocardia miyunensis]|uniref:hypothetical protein n=1 Tax=Nocardia miyunensis TaxID=282684 RepID=UPI0008338B54|nr:hypothetical protein [Nocardia miyunensis]
MQSRPDDAEETDASQALPDHLAVLRDIQTQLRGPDLAGWPQLGTDEDGRHRSLVDAVAAALTQISELRTEVGDLEATIAELEEQVRNLSQPRLPWPLSLAEAPLTALAEQVARLESLVHEALGRGNSEHA